jgi:hypothetical protein
MMTTQNIKDQWNKNMENLRNKKDSQAPGKSQ